MPAHGAVAQGDHPVGDAGVISDCAPMIERVRPAQVTTTSVSGSGASAPMRQTSSPPGTQVAVGMLMTRNSSSGRLSTTTMSAPASIKAFRSWGEIEGVR